MPKAIKKKIEWLEVKCSDRLTVKTTGANEIHIVYSGATMLQQAIIPRSEAKKLANAIEEILNA